MRKLFYARVSTKTQNIERQIKKALEIGVNKIYQEKYTGTTSNRPQFNKMMKEVESGDVIIFDSVSRMSRNAEEGIEAYFNLVKKGVTLEFINEPHINSEIYLSSTENRIEETTDEIANLYIEATNKAMKMIAKKQITLAFEQAEKEVVDLQTRTREGMAVAKANGKQIGRKKGTTPRNKIKIDIDKIKKYSKKYGGEMNQNELARFMNVSLSTLKRTMKNMEGEQND